MWSVSFLTAHHQDDSNESLLLKFLRGTHITHLSGIQPVLLDSHSDDSGDNDLLLFWARPLLHVTKDEIIRHLRDRDEIWREDESNVSDKYLRNRVRNELVPLLTDLVGSKETLQRRLDLLSCQSREMGQFLSKTAGDYLERHTEDGWFLLPPDDQSWDLIHQQALYMWVVGTSRGRPDGPSKLQFSYEHLQRVCDQLTVYPNKRQWRLNIGKGWDIVRQGNALRVISEAEDRSNVPRPESGQDDSNQKNDQSTIRWSYEAEGLEDDDDEQLLHNKHQQQQSNWRWHSNLRPERIQDESYPVLPHDRESGGGGSSENGNKTHVHSAVEERPGQDIGLFAGTKSTIT